MKKYVTYEEFGAVGDGVHDDMQAIADCHGYKCSLPERIDLDLTIEDAHLPHTDIDYVIFHEYDPDYVPGKPYAYGTPKHLTVKISSTADRQIRLCENPDRFPNRENYNL